MPSLNTGNAILSNPIKVETTAYNVGIGGAASGSFKLQVTGTSNLTGALTGTSATFASTAFTNLTLNGTNANGWGNNMAFQSGGTDFGYVGSIGSLLGNTTKDMTIWATSGNGFRVYTNGNNKQLEITTTGAATFSSSVTSPVIKLSDSTLSGAGNFEFTSEAFFGARFQSNAYKFMAGNNTSEYMRITSGGDVLIGDTTASANLWVKSSAAGNTFGARNTNASFAATVAFFGADRNTTNNSFYYIDCYNYGSSSYRFRVADSGEVTSASSIGATQFSSQGGRGTSYGYKLPDWQIYNTTSGNALAFSNYTNDCLTLASSGAATIFSDFSAYGTFGSFGQFHIAGRTDNNKKLVLGYNTSANVGFIQAMQNGTAYSPLLLNSTGGNVLIGTTTDAGQNLQVSGMTNSGISYRAGTYTQGDTTPSVSGVSYLGISNSSPTTITNFTNGIQYQIITLYFSDSNTTINRSNCYLSGGLNFTSTASDILTLINIGGFWYEVSRSVNS